MAKQIMIAAAFLLALVIPAFAQEPVDSPEDEAVREAFEFIKAELEEDMARSNSVDDVEQALLILLDYIEDQLGSEQRMTSILPVKHVQPEVFVDLLEDMGAKVSTHPEISAITITGTDKQLEVVAGAVEMLDKPKAEERPRNVVLTVHMIRGSNGEENEEVPEPLAAVVEELRGVFVQYNQYEVVETFVARCRDNSEVELSGMLPPGESDQRPEYRFGVDQVRVAGESAELVELRQLVVGLQLPVVFGAQGLRVRGVDGAPQPVSRIERRDIGIKADIDVPVGQQVVVGKANYGDGDSALFVVISAEVIDL